VAEVESAGALYNFAIDSSSPRNLAPFDEFYGPAVVGAGALL